MRIGLRIRDHQRETAKERTQRNEKEFFFFEESDDVVAKKRKKKEKKFFPYEQRVQIDVRE